MAIVHSTDKRVDSKKYFSPRIPRSRAGEPSDMRIYVAPTVHQCLGAIPIRFDFDGALSIYKLQCLGAVPVGTEVVEDASYSAECWITDEIITANGGEIPLSLVGVISEPSVMQLRLYDWVSGKQILVSDDQFEAWEIAAAPPVPHWKIRIHPLSSSAKEEPLQFPKREW